MFAVVYFWKAAFCGQNICGSHSHRFLLFDLFFADPLPSSSAFNSILLNKQRKFYNKKWYVQNAPPGNQLLIYHLWLTALLSLFSNLQANSTEKCASR
jgi:hypothetical protein